MKDHNHIDVEFLRAVVLDGALDPIGLIHSLLGHAKDLCPQCHELWRELRRLEAQGTSPSLEFLEEITQDTQEAGEEIARLREMPPEDRPGASTDGSVTLSLIHALLREARVDWSVDTTSARSWTEAALRGLEMGGLESPAVHAYVLAHHANVYRLAHDWLTAAEFHRQATEVLERAEDPFLACEVMSLRASLQIDMRSFSEAYETLGKVVEMARKMGDVEQQVKGLVMLAAAKGYGGEHEEAIRLNYDALGLTEPRSLLHLTAVYNLIYNLVELEYSQQAHELLLYHSDEWPIDWGRRVTWLEGRILASQGETDTAEIALKEARRAFKEAGSPLDVAAISLDLAALYHDLGRLDELPELLAFPLQVFEAYDIPQELYATFRLLHQAAREQALDRAELVEYAAFVRSVSATPGAFPRSGGVH